MRQQERRRPRRLPAPSPLAAVALLACSWPAAAAAGAAGAAAAREEGCAAEGCWEADEGEAEAELMEVALLQTSLKLLGPASAASSRTAASRPTPSSTTGRMQAVVTVEALQPLSIVEGIPEAAALEDAQLGTSLAQTELVVVPSGASSELPRSGASGAAAAPEDERVQVGQQQQPPARVPRSLALALQDMLEKHGVAYTAYPSEQRSRERKLMVFYVSFYLCAVAIMTWYARPSSQSMDSSAKDAAHTSKQGLERRIEANDAEQNAWDQGFVRWLSVSWASPWVAHWGSLPPRLGAEQIKARDLPQLGNANLQSSSCAKVFTKFWQEDLKCYGKDASIFRVVLRVWTLRSMFLLLLLVASQIIIAQVGSVLLLQEALSYFNHLRGLVGQEYMDMTGPLLVWIAAFSALPLSSAVLSSASSSLSCQLDLRLCGGLSVVLFEKAQRLPKYRLRSGGTGSPKASGGAGESANGEAGEEPVDLTSLVGYDVHGSLLGCYHQLCTCIGSGLAIVMLAGLLWSQLGMATLCAAACAVPVVLLLLGMSAGLGRAMYRVQGLVDKRVAALREVLFGIRGVKCCAWEEAVEEKLSALRRDEVIGLQRYYFFLGGFMGVFLSFPRVLILAGLWGYSVLYGRHDVTAIFTCVQILASLKSSCDAFTRSLGRAITVLPSLRRAESFLRLPEAPMQVDVWPSPRGFGPRGPLLEPGTDQEVDAQSKKREPVLRLHGSYRWTEESPPVLRDLQLDAPKGALVAVVGGAGAGKTALLQAVLGELCPVHSQDGSGPAPMLSRPDSIAYCPQVPYIGDGSIRENILFGRPEDEARYTEALRAVALESELHTLPSGDRMPVGPRGLALSSGQRSRVALARAAYRRDAPLAVLDEPFAALGASAAAALVERLLQGPLMRDRTRLVALQPDPDLLVRFDHVVVMAGGRIKEQGPPEAVFQTCTFRQLAPSGPGAEEAPPASEGAAAQDTAAPPPRAAPAPGRPAKEEARGMLTGGAREDFSQGGPTWDMARQYCRLGRWRNIVNASILFCVQIILHVLCDLVLAHWTNCLSRTEQIDDRPFLHGYLLWLCLGVASWLACWKFGEWFTLRISSQIHDLVLSRVLRAPVDRFFDQHPVGRIMNRLSSDLAVVDLFLFMKSTGTMAVVFQTLIPLIYVHLVMPWYVLLLALPLYYYIWAVASQYWNATIPLRYCMSGARASLSSLLADAAANGAIIRAYKDQERVTAEMCEAVDGQLRACLLGERTLRRWLVNRILFLWSFFAASAYVVSLLLPSSMGPGTLGLCLTSLLLLQSLIEPNLDQVTGAQSEFVALARINEYLSIPQERSRECPGDAKYRDFCVRVSRKELRALGELSYATYAYEGSGSAVQVLRNGRALLHSTADCTALVPARPGEAPAPKQAAAAQAVPAAPEGAQLLDLCPSCPELAFADSWHRLVGVGGAVRDAEAMARELCGSCGPGGGEEEAEEDGEQEVLVLDVQSGWLADGARVVVENLKAGYGDAPRDTLKGVSLSLGPRERLGVVGPSGAGKSTLLLALLRILEPRAGRVLLCGVDMRQVGLAALRQALGLVPQEPVLFSGTLRYNIDPFECYSDERIWQAISTTSLASFAESSSRGLDQRLSQEGGDFNLGQRHLLSLARAALRQPALLLLDEAANPLDPHTEACRHSAVRSGFPFSTVIAASRRLDSIMDFDRVVVLERGAVADQGTPGEVAQRRGGNMAQAA